MTPRKLARPAALDLALAAIAGVAVVGPMLVVSNPPDVAVASRLSRARPPQRVVPPAELPPVEPTDFAEVAPEDARLINGTVPFSTAPNPAARPFRYIGAADDLQRATDCLAAAVLYEAGDDAVGERAVAQVVLNRLRHPAFPKTVCGVVFQGHERSTGCQFTFTCDGAIARRPSEGGWRRAREIAAAALTGSVYRPVGHATHYHTDWVVPYWSSSLDKIARVGTHLFFRWTGWWGTPPAFNRALAGGEPALVKLAALSPAHAGAVGVAGVEGELSPVDPAAVAAGAIAGAGAGIDDPLTPDRDSFLMTMPANIAPELWPEVANRTCGDRPYCKLLAWTDPKLTPKRLPLDTRQIASMSFSFLRDRELGVVRRLWDCRKYKRPVPAQCMRAQVYVPAGEIAEEAKPVLLTPPRGPDELEGVRRRAAERPGPPATPTPSARATPAGQPAPSPRT